MIVIFPSILDEVPLGSQRGRGVPGLPRGVAADTGEGTEEGRHGFGAKTDEVTTASDGPELDASLTTASIGGDRCLGSGDTRLEIDGLSLGHFEAAPVGLDPTIDGVHRRGVAREDGSTEGVPATVGDDLVRVSVNLDNTDAAFGGAAAPVEEAHAGDADDGGDGPRELTGEPVGHEPAVGEAEDVDPLGIDGSSSLGVGDDGGEVADIIDAAVLKIATGWRGVPEAAPQGAARPLGDGVDEALALGDARDLEYILKPGSGGSIAVEKEDEGGLVRCRNARRHAEDVGALTEEISFCRAGIAWAGIIAFVCYGASAVTVTS